MGECKLYPQCGGCSLRNLSEIAYRQHKYSVFQNIIKKIKQLDIKYGEPVFIPDGTRRRAVMTFKYTKKKVQMGFNVAQSHEMTDCSTCFLLTDKINKNLASIRELLEELCSEPCPVKKGKKIILQHITQGDVHICEADNGLDVMFEIPFSPELAHRMIISEKASVNEDIIRISWLNSKNKEPETLIEKTRPLIHNSGVEVYLPSGTFLQASQAGEQALINLVLRYIGDKTGNIADLFCGIGTFSYPLAQNKKNQILAIDSSAELLNGFRQSVNRNQLTNIKIEARNLFKYPLDEQELAKTDIVIFDPPRAGAAAQTQKLANSLYKPKTVIAVSCNPHTFVNDANTLLGGGYKLKEITMVDQFIYSRHTELVALFEKE